MLKVGYVHNGYPESRNILSDEKRKKTRLIKVFDLFKLRDWVNFKLTSKLSRYLHNSFNDQVSFPKADVYHFFNGVNYGNKPWVSTFETILPRYVYPKESEKAVKTLAKKNCKRLLAFSEFNKNMQLSFLRDNFPDYIESIKDKIEVLYPPQEVNSKNNTKRFEEIDVLRCLFVGHDFFRKGGREVYNVIEELVHNGAKIELTVVSKLTSDNYISHTNTNDEKEWKEKLINSEFCNYDKSLSSEKVNDLMGNHHLFLFPSFQETFGYVVLEAQAQGLPVVSTSIRALPEINNNECGWLIDVQQNERGFADVFTFGYKEISEKIKSGLNTHLKEILKDKGCLKTKSKASLERIKIQHDPQRYFNRLEEIYLER